MKCTEPSAKANWAPPEWKLKAQSSLITLNIRLGLTCPLMGLFVLPLVRTTSSEPVEPIQTGQSLNRVGGVSSRRSHQQIAPHPLRTFYA
jgi:hypothetical protein